MRAEPTSPLGPLGRYRLLCVLGHGGMADVYLAVHQGPGGFNKLVVVKELRAALAQDSLYVDMFLDEARLAAKMHHPNLVQTNEVGESDGRFYLAMEYLDGQPFHKVMYKAIKEPNSIPFEVLLRVLSEVLSGLDYAHNLCDYDGQPLNIVHRDATPQNIFVTYDGTVKVLDFGIAKASDAIARTHTGTFKGKVAYVAPEQAAGLFVDRRADIFSVGVMLWEVAVGRRLWGTMPEVAILHAISRGQIPDPSEVDAGVPKSLAKIIMRALAFNASDRYETAAEMQADIDRFAAATGERPTAKETASVMAAAFNREKEKQRTLFESQLRSLNSLQPDSSPRSVSALIRSGAANDYSTERRDAALGSTPTHVRALPSSQGTRPTSHGDAGASVSLNEAPTKVESTLEHSRQQKKSQVLNFAPMIVVVVAVATVLWAQSRVNRTPGNSSSASIDAGATISSSMQPHSLHNDGEKPRIELTGDIVKDSVLTADREYLLKFTLRVMPGVTLTIEPGTTIVGDNDTKGVLLVQPGGKLVADGKPDKPIVFTSQKKGPDRKAGDWGGVILMGRAPINLRNANGTPTQGVVEGLTSGGRYGGSDPEDSSGVMRYVRIEYSGIQIAPNNEINGLTLAGVGRGTLIDYVQVRHTADDCFEFFGGTVNAKHLACQHSGDDGFDWDYGYTGKLQFLVLQENPNTEEDTNGFEGDNDPNGTNNNPISEPVIYNVTLCGKRKTSEHEHYGMLFRRGTKAHIFNTIVTGFDAALDIRDRSTSVEISNSIFWGNVVHNLAYPEKDMKGVYRDDDGGFDEKQFLLQARLNNRESDPKIDGCFDRNNPTFAPRMPLSERAAQPPNDGFFDTSAQFIGALKDTNDDWLSGDWLRWGDN